ncbi:MAG: CHAP domain-containing protein [Novosphingobium sp.]|nr:CHAP domain-containing protein [Novosphingobium sp.]
MARAELADSAVDLETVTDDESGTPAQRYLQCVPYARQISGIRIYGDAHTWWDQAAGRYGRGFAPKVGAVMAFKPYGKMVLGHVAAVSRIVDSRTVLLRHANWSPINGQRGQIEDDVEAVDVSPDNDWSAVRVWFDPIQGLGSTHWPVQGFIYNKPLGEPDDTRLASSSPTRDPIGAIIAAHMRLASR